MLQALFPETLHLKKDERVLVLNSAPDPSIPWLVQQLSQGELLLAEDSLAAEKLARSAVERTGVSRKRLRLVAFHEYTRHEAPAVMDTALLNILYQPNNAWMHYALQVAAYALKPGGRLYITGAKDRGILSLGKRARELFGNLETLKISKGQRVICSIKGAESTGPAVEPVLAAFNEGKIDEGTTLLLETLEIHATDTALDLGCGSGLIGAHIAAQAPKGQVTLVDSSRASVAAAQRLLEERGLTNARTLVSDGVQAVQEQRFDLIATNPPFHVGGIQTTAVAERLIREAATIMQPRGRFYLVANRFLRYEPTLRACFSNVEEVHGNTRFKVLRATGLPSKAALADSEKEGIIFSIDY